MAKILVIDDDAGLLEMIRIALEQRGGHQVMLSADGAEGLAMALADPPDLAIIDIMMPDLDGYAVCRQLRAHSETASVPILVLTARGQPVDRQAAIEAGADDYMAKPVAVRELLDGVEAVLARSSARASVPAAVVVLLSLRGGVGVTTLAVNLAATLAQASEGAACLVDFCPSSGHAALQLGLRPDPNWSDMLSTEKVDLEAVEAHLLVHQCGLRVLASPVIPLVGRTVPRQVVQAILGTLQQRFPLVIVDTPSILDETTMAALEAATSVGLVVTAEHPTIQTAIGTLRACEQWSDKIHVILNQIRPKTLWPAEAVGRVLGRASMSTIPFDPAQAEALRQGRPLALQSPDAPFVEAVQELAHKLAQR